MAYLQITTRCNMTCAHCCFDCTAKGEDMSMDTFRRALSICKNYDEHITIGGGEPTLHKDFEKMLLMGMAACSEETGPVLVITNGSIKNRALLIADLLKRKSIFGGLSHDQYHATISEEVVEAFRKINGFWSGRYSNYKPIFVGRATTQLSREECRYDGCACDTMFFVPNGDIKQCGCLDSPIIGNVKTGITKGIVDHNICWKEL